MSTPIATTGPSGARCGRTISATAAYHACTWSRNAALAYDGTGHARGGDGIHTGVPRAVARLTRGLGEHVVGHPEARQLGVDVRARPQHDGEPGRARRVEEPREIARRVHAQRAGASGSWTRHGT